MTRETYPGGLVAFLSSVVEEVVETAMMRAGRESAGIGWETVMRLIDMIRSNPHHQSSPQE